VGHKLGVAVILLVCVALIVGYQVRQQRIPSEGGGTFVPPPAFFLDASPSFRTSIADAYYLGMMQYYGANMQSHQLQALPEMTELITTLSPKFLTAYYFGSFALVDAGHPELGKALLETGFENNPQDVRLPLMLAFFSYHYGEGKDKSLEAARWYQRAAKLPGAPEHIDRLIAVMLGKGGETEKAIIMWGQVYADGDELARQKAVDGLNRILPEEKVARMKAAAPLYQTMSKEAADALVAELFRDYVR